MECSKSTEIQRTASSNNNDDNDDNNSNNNSHSKKLQTYHSSLKNADLLNGSI